MGIVVVVAPTIYFVFFFVVVVYVVVWKKEGRVVWSAKQKHGVVCVSRARATQL